MPYIELPADLPGILGPMAAYPDTARPLNQLAETLLRAPGTLTPAERELIATHVSARNECLFCRSSHGAVAAYRLGGDNELVATVERDPESAPVSDKLKALLAIAGKVQRSGREVTPDAIERARREGATDREIHDTVLIAAAFCMYNRYVDGLATWAPEDRDAYAETGERLAERGYTATPDYLAASPAA
jgi:uncharacterized peroxidase-related enzyme